MPFTGTLYTGPTISPTVFHAYMQHRTTGAKQTLYRDPCFVSAIDALYVAVQEARFLGADLQEEADNAAINVLALGQTAPQNVAVSVGAYDYRIEEEAV